MPMSGGSVRNDAFSRRAEGLVVHCSDGVGQHSHDGAVPARIEIPPTVGRLGLVAPWRNPAFPQSGGPSHGATTAELIESPDRQFKLREVIPPALAAEEAAPHGKQQLRVVAVGTS